MDYNENDFEGQDFQLAGEESSKDSSALRPYPLPKFDFDDSLHGHLRFDSLVESEAFLGITSHEDNRWIEDFSHPGNGIEFSSRAPESCSLPSRINVWSEATSSESVEMLLKAVVQEETDPVESLMQESNTLNEQGTSTEDMDNPLMKDDINTDSSGGNSSLPPIEVEGNVSTPILNTGIVGNHVEDTLGAQLSECSSDDPLVVAEESNLLAVTESSAIEALKTDRDHGETRAMENESVSNPVNVNFQVQGKLIDNNEFPFQEVVTRIESTMEDRVMGVEVDDTEREFRVEMPDSVCGEPSSNDATGVSVVEIDQSKDVAIDTKTIGDASYESMSLSPATEVNQVSEDPSAAEDGEVMEITNSMPGSITVCADVDLMQDPVVKLSDEEKSSFADGNISHAINTSLDAHHSSLMPSGLCKAATFPIKMDGQRDINDDESQIKSKNPTIIGDIAGDESLLDIEQDLRNINAIRERHDHDCNVLVESMKQPSTEGTLNLSYVLNSDVGDKSMASSAEAREMLATPGANLQSSETQKRDPGGGTLSHSSKKTGTSVTVECLSSDENNSYIESEEVPVHDSVVVKMMESGEANLFSENPTLSVPSEPSDEESKKIEPSGSSSAAHHESAGAEIETKSEKKVENNDKGNNFSVGHSGMEQDKTFVTATPDPVCDGFPVQGNNIKIGEVLVNSQPSEVDSLVEERRGCSANDGNMAPQSTCDFGKDASGSSKADDLTSNIVPNVSSSTPGLGSSSEDLRAPSNRKSRRGGSKVTRGGAKGANQMKETTPMRQTEILEKSSHFQPFTDLQQVQLRAQIIVYGSLIQGAAPDEACMLSAFDGDRNLWEMSWRACVDRLKVRTMKANIVEASVSTRLDAKAPDHIQRHSFSEGEVLSAAATHSRKKIAASPIVNPMIPLSSPLWAISGDSHPSISTVGAVDYQIVSSLNHYQTPPVRKYAANSSWSTLAPLPWLAPTQSSPFDFGPSHPALPITSPLKLGPIADSSLPVGVGLKQFTPIPAAQPGQPSDVLAGPSVELKNLKVSSEQNSEKTTRKRKKSAGHADPPPVSGIASFVDPKPTTGVGNYSSKKGLGVEDSGKISFVPHTRGEPMHMAAIGSHYSTSVTVATPSMHMPKSSTSPFFSLNPPSVSGDTLRRADLSGHGRALNAESFKKAEEATLQAHEAEASAASAVAYCESVWNQLDRQSTSGVDLDVDSKLALAAAAIAAAASVAKAAAAAAKIAENVAAHEKQMFEEALIMSQTAKTAVYDSNLVSSSTNTLISASTASIFNGLNHSTLGIPAAREAARKRIEAASAATRHAENLDAIVKAAELAAEAVSHAGKIVAMTNPLSSRKLVEAGPDNYWKDPQLESNPVSKPNYKGTEETDALGASGIQEGARVEVLRDSTDSKKAWFSATVLGFREGEVLVCYTDIQSTEGSEQLKEWVSLGPKDNNAPRVRTPHPLSSVPHERAKKRPRDASRDYNWSLGDRVDVWMDNCWCEGIISEKNKKDESAMRIKFPDQEQTTLVKVWHLRPTLNWDGTRWVEVPRLGSNTTFKGDTPAKKRAKVASEITDKGKQIGDADAAEAHGTERPTLPLSADEKKFSIGRQAEGNKPKAIRGTRSSLEKERSRVVFGVPKPGKKRKFMEVSKHYVSEPGVKSNLSSDSDRLAKFLAPHGRSSQSSETSLKVEVKEKQPFQGKARAARSAKASSNTGRTLPRKDDSTASKPDECDDSVSDHVGKGSASGAESELGEQHLVEHGSNSNQDENSGDAMVFSSKALPPLNRKKVPIPSGRSLKRESNETLISDASEPRRSVRRIQPTSRLLEGLQSSLIISKSLSSSHDKLPTKTTTARGNSGR